MPFNCEDRMVTAAESDLGIAITGIPVVSDVDENIVISPSLVTSIRSCLAAVDVPSPMTNAAESPVTPTRPFPLLLYCPKTVAECSAVKFKPNVRPQSFAVEDTPIAI